MDPNAQKSNLKRGLLSFVMMLGIGLATFGQQPKHALTNEEITKMVKGGFTEDVIVALIESNDTDFDVSLGGLTALKEAGVGGKVMEAMLKAEARKRQSPGATTAAPASTATAAPAASPTPTATTTPPMGPPGFDAQAMQSMMTNMMPDMSTMISPQAMKHMPKAMRQQMMQQMMQQKMMKASMGMSSQFFPRVLLASGNAKQELRPSMTEIAEVPKNGNALGAAGSALTSSSSRALLQSVAMQALSFAAIGAGPAGMAGMGIASQAFGISSMLGGHGGGTVHVNYVWGLPGHSAALVTPNSPNFELNFADLPGMDPDAYEPVLVRMEPTKDNWRLVGLSKLSSKDLSGGIESPIVEDRVSVNAHRLDRGHYEVNSQGALEPGEYAMVLRPLQAGKKKGVATRDQQAETELFFSVWDFSVK